MRRRQVAELALLLVGLALAGCRPRISLTDKPVESIDVRMDHYPLCPGETSQLSIWAKLKDGQTLASENVRDGSVAWASYLVLLNGQRLEGGQIQIPSDPTRVQLPSRLDVSVVGHPQVQTSFGVPIHFKCAFVADFHGQHGREGTQGRNGAEGRKGQDGKSTYIDGKYVRDPGGSGSDGSNGGNGADGEPGRDAEDVEVRVTMAQPTPDQRLLQVRVYGVQTRREQLFLVDPQGGSLTVSAVGGQGGHGGPGGKGGDGGNAADGGRGGKISVSVSASAQQYPSVLHFENHGGRGGNGGSAGRAGNAGAFGQHFAERGREGESGLRSGRDGPAGPKPEIKVDGN